MNYLLVLLEGFQSPNPNIDALAASGRLGFVEGWKGVESLMPREAEDGKATFTCGIASLDKEFNVSGFVTEKDELHEIAEAISGIEIDGVKFDAKTAGNCITLGICNEELSRKIAPNPCTPGMPLAQVCAASSGTGRGCGRHPAKKTASILNKLIYRVTKSFPGRALFVKTVGATQKLPDNFELMKLSQGIDGALLTKIKDAEDLVTILIWNKGHYDPAPVLIHGGAILPGGAKKFSEAACSRGFRVRAEDLLPWVLRATFKRKLGLRDMQK